MSTKINVRSPYYVKVSSSSPTLGYATMNLYIYEGTTKGSADYTLTKSVVGSNDFVVFEISELIRSYLYSGYDNGKDDAVWVEADIDLYQADGTSISTVNNDYLAVNGYRYFEDGDQTNELSKQLLQDNTLLSFLEGEDFYFPVWAEDEMTISFSSSGGSAVGWEVHPNMWSTSPLQSGNITSNIIIADSTDSANKIQYVKMTGTENLSSGDTITVGSTVITLESVCEPKYTPLNILFYNKLGAMQNIWMYKRSDTSINIKTDSYNANIMDLTASTPTFSTSEHQNKVLNTVGNEVIRCNTGYIDEDYNAVIKQLLLSESVWIDNGTDVLPVNVSTNSLAFKKNVNEKLIDYSIEFSYAYDKINNIR